MSENKKVFALYLNDMRSAKSEHLQLAAVALDKQKLLDLMSRDEERWEDGHWNKSFKKGSPLEWFNENLGESKGIVEIEIEGDSDVYFVRSIR